MPASVIVGLQWGDEGKGKTTDLLCGGVSHVVRYQGGDNAGHTVVIGDEVFKLHLVPSGVLHPHITPVIGPGVVVNPQTLLDELAMLEGRGIDTSRLRVSAAAHVIMPYHIALDGAREVAAEHEAIGTTRRGIGPAYGDRALRTGIRMGDLLEPDWLRLRLAAVLAEKNQLLDRAFGAEPFELEALLRQALAWGERLRPHMTLVELRLGEVVYESGSAQRHIYFPVSGIVTSAEDGRPLPSVAVQVEVFAFDPRGGDTRLTLQVCPEGAGDSTCRLYDPGEDIEKRAYPLSGDSG